MNLGDLIKTDKQLVRVADVAKELGLSKETIYDWKYRSTKRKIPTGMFVKVGKMLFINTVILNNWLISQTIIS